MSQFQTTLESVAKMDTQQVVVYKQKTSKFVWLLLGSALLSVTSLSMFVIDHEIIGIVGGVLFGLFSGIFIVALRYPLSLTLSSQGFSSKAWGKKYTIAWNDVVGFEKIDTGNRAGISTSMVGFKFIPGVQSPFPKTSEKVRAIYGYDGGLSADSFGLSTEQLANTLNEWRIRYATKPA